MADISFEKTYRKMARKAAEKKRVAAAGELGRPPGQQRVRVKPKQGTKHRRRKLGLLVRRYGG